ncbi:hypothetical protein [Streptomyces sp. MBT65]|uniref:hypothetical protein n=1 Tax=Streptomyces sp. MBT65 TaxID=1488395 RepID=UPI001F382A8E|nr:hypothetical protein [Streptomyces sp. MBT65]
MRFRAVLVVLFVLPLLWGALSLLRAGAAYGAPDCPGLQLDAEGESSPGPMRKGDRCALSYDTATGRSTGTSTYDQLKFAQEVKRRSLGREGALFVLYGAAGIGVTFAATRKRGA